ncbi:MAG TPA: glycoside hydrolase family 2 [Candidatus Scatomorpha pullicola]|nr:glycoside hydrolase family 2 [Candidatus Scatomorpha pullicola]
MMLTTKWGEALDREHPLPEYPRPQLRRESFLNLNGVWQYAVSTLNSEPEEYDGDIVVPFPLESELSGVGRVLQPGEYLWYRREFTLPEDFNVGRVLLHFGAVDQCARVWVNGMDACTHTGGYLPFSADITDLLFEGENTLVVRVTDDTDRSYHTRGKQKLKPGGIWYSPVSGIWQTVWCESVPENYISSLFITPHLEDGSVELLVMGEGAVRAVIDGDAYDFEAGTSALLKLREVRAWSPEEPYLYKLELAMGDDRVESYFAMRSVGIGEDRNGVKRLLLNGKPYFQNGLLDQGWWPDGLYTAPSDEALAFDIAAAKTMGFNMLRKHVKVEPLRWYYHCDRLGMLVWQDMPNGGGAYSALTVSAPLLTGSHSRDDKYSKFARREEKGRDEFREELLDMVSHLYNAPSIVTWVIFNEGWGQFDSDKCAEAVLELDSSRILDRTSGWHDQGSGELRSIHLYFDDYKHKPDKLGRCVVLSEFGGYTLPIDGHAWPGKPFGYKKFDSQEKFRRALTLLYDGQIRPACMSGLAAAIYTQLTDVENELNGLITYDRRVIKLSPADIKRITAMPAVK